MTEPVPVHPAATVVLLRDGESEVEVLLLRRNSRLVFHGGAWVFPGGRIDPGDYATPDQDLWKAARVAAVREAREEAGLVLDHASFVDLSRWVTPAIRPKRFDTFFFISAVDRASTVEVDGGEILDHRWFAPGEAIDARERGEIELPPPTFVTLSQIAHHRRAEDVLSHVAQQTPLEYRPRVKEVDGGMCSLYAGDAGYETANVEVEGPRHRLWMLKSDWRYERS